MKYLLILDHVNYKEDRSLHTVLFKEMMVEFSSRSRHQFDGNFKAVICDDLREGMKLLRDDVKDWLRGCYWFNPAFSDSIEIRGSFSEILDNGRLWATPCISSAETVIKLVEK